MSLDTVMDSSESAETDDQGNSKTQLVFWRDAEPQGYDNPDEAQYVEQAYQLCMGSGFLRNTLDASGQYEDIHSLAAELMVGVAEVLQNGNFQPILETIGPNAEAIEQYLEENPEIREELTGE